MEVNLKKYPITTITIGILVLIYVVTTLMYGLSMNAYQGIEVGAFNPIYVLYNHDYYRLITANFLHFGIFHIFCNCYSLFNVGCLMEIILGKFKYIIVMIASGLGSTLLPLFIYQFNGSGIYTVTAGFSGVIFGLIGALMALALVYKNVFMELFKRISPSLIMMLIISVSSTSISLSGHVGGLIGGFLATMIIIKIKPNDNWGYRVY